MYGTTASAHVSNNSDSPAQQSSYSVIVAGSRAITDCGLTRAGQGIRVNDAIVASGFQIREVVSGTARGIDQLGELWAEARNIPIVQFPADWDAHGRAAGPIRNEEMAEYADALVAIWVDKSPGTANMIENGREFLGDERVHVKEITSL